VRLVSDLTVGKCSDSNNYLPNFWSVTNWYPSMVEIQKLNEKWKMEKTNQNRCLFKVAA